MSWLTEAVRITAAMGIPASFSGEDEARAWLESNAPTWQATGLTMNLANEAVATSIATGEAINAQGQVVGPATTETAPDIARAGFGLAAVLPWIGKALPWIGKALPFVGSALAGAGAAGLAGGGGQVTVGDVPVGGPGVPEPPVGMVAKQWSVAVHSNTIGTFRIFYFRLIDGRTLMYNPATKGWKIWRDYKSIVIGKSLTTRNVVRVSKRLRSHVYALRKVLKIMK